MKFDAEDIFCDDPAALTAIKNFGIKYLYPWQRLVIGNILDAHERFTERMEGLAVSQQQEEEDCLGRQIVLLPTGAGKSLCFQIPALLLNGPTLVIYPLLALMSDQHRRMVEGGMDVVIFRGGQSAEEREENFLRLKNGAKIIIANPEVLASGDLCERLSKAGIAHVAIDEAHCVSEWGDTFRPAYLELGPVLKKLAVPVVTAFTATASPEVLSRISDVLFGGEAHIVRSESDRPNIHYYVKNVAAKKQAVLVLAKTEPRPMIVFCGTRSRTEDMTQELNTAYGMGTAKFYHAGLERDEKTEIEEWFFNQKDAVLCATCAYGMGVDKKDIHTVVHLDPPLTAEAYIQEAGRGGRDGSVANAILLWSQEDRKRFAEFKTGTRKAALKDFAEATDCRRQVLLNALGAEQAVCDGCDICENREWFSNRRPEKEQFFTLGKLMNLYNYSKRHFIPRTMPSWKLPEDAEIIYRLIKSGEKYFDLEKLETTSLKLLNQLTLPFTEVNIWEHTGFAAILGQLLSQRRVRICKWPWKGRLATVKKNRHRIKILRLIHLEYKKRIILRRRRHQHQLHLQHPQQEPQQVQAQQQPSSPLA